MKVEIHDNWICNIKGKFIYCFKVGVPRQFTEMWLQAFIFLFLNVNICLYKENYWTNKFVFKDLLFILVGNLVGLYNSTDIIQTAMAFNLRHVKEYRLWKEI